MLLNNINTDLHVHMAVATVAIFKTIYMYV